jgi:DNA polymerase-1
MLVKIIDEHHRPGSSSPGTRACRARGHLRPLQGAAQTAPDLLREQWPHLMPLVEAFGYTNVKVEGYEADDVIASLTRQAREQGIPVMVVTGDRDAYQLVGPGCG